jgi:uncharacterized protein
MKNLSLLLFLCLSTSIFSQIPNTVSPPYIEVTGTAKREVEPNQIFITIILTEKSIDNKKYSIDFQENKLLQILSDLNISKSKLTLSDFSSSILTEKRKEVGFKQSKQFSLLLENAQQVSQLFEKLFDANIKEADVTKIDHTDIVNFNKEVRIEAVKAAKAKAEYLANAVGNKIGKPLEIIEQNADTNFYRGNANNLNISNTAITLSSSEFKKIIITFSFKVKYLIE